MIFDYPERASEPEILDDLSIDSDSLRQNLKEIEKVNQKLGAYTFLKKELKKLIKEEEDRNWRLADLGCGGGDALRALYKDPYLKDRISHWQGLDFNPMVLGIAKEFSNQYPIQFEKIDLLNPDSIYEADIGMFNLVLHHFADDEIVALLQRASKHCQFLLISDLHRNAVAYHSFRVLSRFWKFGKVSQHDGKLSVLKSFTRRDWDRILSAVPHRQAQIHWHWSFRWNLILKL